MSNILKKIENLCVAIAFAEAGEHDVVMEVLNIHVFEDTESNLAPDAI